MKAYARSLLVGLCAAAVVLGVFWSVRVVKHAAYAPPPSSHPSPLAPSDDEFTVQTSEDILAVTVTASRPPWYVSVLAGLALVTASGWQLRRSWRDRR
jgi:hypothetical protein